MRRRWLWLRHALAGCGVFSYWGMPVGTVCRCRCGRWWRCVSSPDGPGWITFNPSALPQERST